MSIHRRYQTRTAWTLILTMLFPLVLPTFVGGAQDTGTSPIQLVTEQPIGEGVTLQTYNKKISGKKSWVYVTKVDLNNPYAQVKPLYGKNGAFTAKQTVEALAKEKGAIAAINADFFTLKNKTPFGISVDQQEVVSSMARVPAWYSLGILQDQTAIIDYFNYNGKVTTSTGESFPIQGVNKEQYMATGIQSHKDQINLYTPKFGATSIGSLAGLGDYTEVVVENSIVKDIRVKQPNGATIPADGYVLWGNGSGSTFLSSKFKVGDYVDITSSHTSTSGREDILSAMGGHLLLVDNGKALQPYDRTITGKVSRSAVGVSQNGKTLYLVAVEGSPNGRGMELGELAQTMQELGVYRAANLDGGGSTTMVARKLAETNLSLINVTAYGSQRQIPTAIGVFNTAPVGAFKDYRIEGPAQVLKGTEATFTVKGWDEHFHPHSINPSDVTWTGMDTFTGNKLLALTTGEQEIKTSYQGVEHTKKIEVIGAAAVAKLIVEPSIVAVQKGESASFKVKVQTKDGKVVEITPQAATASVPSELGTIDSFTFTGGQTDSKGQMTVDFDGFEVNVPISVGTIVEPHQFNDIKTGSWYEEAVVQLHKEGIVSGMSKDTFAPNATLTRAQFTTLLGNWLGWTAEPEQSLDFKDQIPEYAVPAVKAALAKGIVQGFPGKLFKPNEPLTRAQMAVMLYLALQDRGDQFVLGQAPQPFTDEKTIPDWATEAVQVMSSKGYIKGMDNAFEPNGQATRAQAAALIYQIKQ